MRGVFSDAKFERKKKNTIQVIPVSLLLADKRGCLLYQKNKKGKMIQNI